MKELLSGLDPAGVGVLITAQQVDKRRSFYKWVQKTAEFTAVAGGGKDSVQALVAMIQEQCKEAGVQITRETVQLLIGKVQGNTRLIAEETRKLCTFAGWRGRSTNAWSSIWCRTGVLISSKQPMPFSLSWTGRAGSAAAGIFFTNNDSRGLLEQPAVRLQPLLIQLRVLLDAGAMRDGRPRHCQVRARGGSPHLWAAFRRESGRVTSMCLLQDTVSGARRELHAKCRSRKLVDFQIAFTEAL